MFGLREADSDPKETVHAWARSDQKGESFGPIDKHLVRFLLKKKNERLSLCGEWWVSLGEIHDNQRATTDKYAKTGLVTYNGMILCNGTN